jgi:hypothetical protein
VSDSKFPSGPRLPSIPKPGNRSRELEDTAPPEEDNPIALMRDLRGALTNVGEKITKLETYLLRQEMAILTEEHKTNHAHDRIDAHAREFALLVERVIALEGRTPEAAE